MARENRRNRERETERERAQREEGERVRERERESERERPMDAVSVISARAVSELVLSSLRGQHETRITHSSERPVSQHREMMTSPEHVTAGGTVHKGSERETCSQCSDRKSSANSTNHAPRIPAAELPQQHSSQFTCLRAVRNVPFTFHQFLCIASCSIGRVFVQLPAWGRHSGPS